LSLQTRPRRLRPCFERAWGQRLSSDNEPLDQQTGGESMQNFRRLTLVMAVVAFVVTSAFAAAPIGPVGNVTNHKTVVALDGPIAPTGPVSTSQCYHWKLGDDNQSG